MTPSSNRHMACEALLVTSSRSGGLGNTAAAAVQGCTGPKAAELGSLEEGDSAMLPQCQPSGSLQNLPTWHRWC